MSTKRDKKSTSGNMKKGDESQRENILQAVVLTDSYKNRFRPLTQETPRCLLPLANMPLIDYTLEFLARAGVEEVFMFVKSHSDKIEEYIRNSRWNRRSSPFKKCQIILSSVSYSVGDAMRELDAKGLISTDFLLVNGDLVSNMNLEGVLTAHRERRTKNKDAIMTMVLRESGFEHRTKAREESGVFVIEEASQRCVHYEEMRPNSNKVITVPHDLLKSNPQLRIRTDLIDCQIDICSPDVPALFSENFDYQSIRQHFLHGILTDYDLYGKTVHIYILNHSYAARVRNLQTYNAVSKDIISRWTYPFVPDNNFGESQNYEVAGRNIYKEEDVSLAISCTISRNTILGRDVMIDEGSVVGNSVIGDGCRIGRNVILDHAYIWDGASIGDGCTIKNSIIANGALVGENCIIEGGIISYDVEVEAGSDLPRLSKITCYKKKKDCEASEGQTFSGAEYEASESESEGEQAAIDIDGLVLHTVEYAEVDDSDISLLPDEEDDSDDDSDDETRRNRRKGSDSAGTENPEESWHKEAASSLLSAMTQDQPPEVAALELNGLRMTANASWTQTRRALSSALVNRIEHLVAVGEKNVRKVAIQVLQRWKPLIERCMHEAKDQIDLLVVTHRECADHKTGGILLMNIAHALYDPVDLVSEEGVKRWWKDPRGTETEKLATVRTQTAAFIKWLEEAESEDEESEEEESEEEESDDE